MGVRKAEHQHKTHGSVCLTCTIERVREITDEPITDAQLEFYKKTISETMADLDPNRVKWAIEDESERAEWENWLIYSAVAAYYRRKAKNGDVI